ncbi:MAG: hypothetical protein FWC91_02665 [Defluviitaleaceae bacterium]|nr:hypothetical protein [Defluviitaleaceae bacterium]
MDIKNMISKMKNSLFDNNPLATYKKSKALEEMKRSLSIYETRRHEVENSDEPIEGIFYIHNGQLIPDYYSECLFSEIININPLARSNSKNPHLRAMRHECFYGNYINKVYAGEFAGSDFLPRGRISKVDAELTHIFIDKCYFKDEDMLKQLVKLYRLYGMKLTVCSTTMYCCNVCQKDEAHLRSYNMLSDA